MHLWMYLVVIGMVVGALVATVWVTLWTIERGEKRRAALAAQSRVISRPSRPEPGAEPSQSPPPSVPTADSPAAEAP